MNYGGETALEVFRSRIGRTGCTSPSSSGKLPENATHPSRCSRLPHSPSTRAAILSRPSPPIFNPRRRRPATPPRPAGPTLGRHSRWPALSPLRPPRLSLPSPPVDPGQPRPSVAVSRLQPPPHVRSGRALLPPPLRVQPPRLRSPSRRVARPPHDILPAAQPPGHIHLLFWCFNLGGVLGWLLLFSFNYHSGNDAASVNDDTYMAFMAFMLLGAALTLLVLPPSWIVRDDGTKATTVTYSSPATEFAEILALFANWRMLLVLPASWASNFFYTYQFHNVNDLLFTLRTKGLNNIFYWGAQMLGSATIGYFLDFGFASRRKRGLVGIVAVAMLGTAMFQNLIYWIIGALANDSQVPSRYVGFYKGVQVRL